MKLGLRAILLVVAVVLFVLAAVMDQDQGDVLALGLAAFAASFAVVELDLDRRFGGKR